MRRAQGIRTVALLEAAKGVVVLLTGFGLFALLHRNVQVFAEELVRHSHLNPASHMPRVFIDYAGHLDDAGLMQLAFAAIAYSSVRLVEAYGLWFERAWGEGVAAFSGAIYLPFELRELFTKPGLLTFCLLLINLAIVLFMIDNLLRRRSAPPPR
ncbi:DUF2127 domain-containing protein [uncultured Massilia sp.]|uniref:DUF2127 domain-containing protein n=1 Tax=uncultured Massilia sp. TaxID=169973 RepID=UPI00258AA891|nr:DUF2127 domain-containing protein [uncultured Massilia sp.]